MRYVEKCGDQRKTTMEYILINKVNDSLENAKELAKILRRIPSKINLIPFNPFPGSNLQRPSNMRVTAFKSSSKGGLYNNCENHQRREISWRHVDN